MMTGLINASLERRRTVLSTLLLILMSGFYAYNAIPKESSPDINIPIIYISMSLEGISPGDAERLLLRPMEQELTSIEGVKEMSASGYTGGGFVLLEFQAGFDKEKALDDVQKAVDQAKSELPESLDRDPSVREVNFSLFPVLAVTLSGDVPERTLLRLARNLKDKIESIDTVLEANISGNREELVEIIVDPLLIESYGLNGSSILSFFNRSNKLVAAGELDTGAGRFAVKVPGLFESTEDIMSMPLRTSGDSVITVKDIAHLRRTFKDPENFARINGKRAVALNVVKRSGENIIDTIEKVKAAVREEEALWPAGVEINYILDQSQDIRNMLKDLQNNVISAILLVMVVIVAALGLRAAGLVGIAIPGAFLSGVLVLFTMGLTVNVVVLFSLILSVGMLVDGAIVVTEYADRKMAEGFDKLEAYRMASLRMAWPITASTATTLAAFFPLLFWPGIVGEFMKFMPITLIAVLGSSLFMALVFVPVLGSLFGKPGTLGDPEAMRRLSASEQGNLQDIGGFTGRYVQFLGKVIRMPGRILAGTVFLLVAIQMLYGAIGKGVEFFPDIEPEVGIVLVHARGNLSANEENQLVKSVEARILDVEGVRVFYTEAGRQDSQGNDEFAEDVIGKISMEFDDWWKRKSANALLQDIRDRTQDIAGIMIETRKQEEGPPGGKALQVQLSSRYPEILPRAVEVIREGLNEIGDFVDIEDSRPLPGIQWEMKVDRAQASKFGIDLSIVGDYIRMITNGLEVSEYRPNDSNEEIDIVIRHSASERTLDQLDRVHIDVGSGSVPISNFVKKEAKPSVGTIDRVDQKRAMTIKADLPPFINTDAKVTQVKEWLEKHKMRIDPRIDIEFKGEDEDQKEAQAFLMRAFVVALFIMAIILVTQFNSFYDAFLILFAVVMSTIGVMTGLVLTQQPFGIVMSGVGVIALAGIVVNNNIVLIDTFKRLVATGKFTVHEAVLRTGAQRLRPVMLTTITTILGLMPMVLQINIDFVTREVSHGAPSTQWWVQLATAVVFGLGFSTILTLVVTPSALIFKEEMQRKLQKLCQKKKSSTLPQSSQIQNQ